MQSRERRLDEDFQRKLEWAIVHHALWVRTSEKETAARASGSANADLLNRSFSRIPPQLWAAPTLRPTSEPAG